MTRSRGDVPGPEGGSAEAAHRGAAAPRGRAGDADGVDGPAAGSATRERWPWVTPRLSGRRPAAAGPATTGAPPGSGPVLPAGSRRAGRARRPLYPRLLRLRHVHPNAWQRAALGEGGVAAAVLLVLADLASAWTLLVLPLAVAAVVKAHDVLAGFLARTPSRRGRQPGDPAGDQARLQPG